MIFYYDKIKEWALTHSNITNLAIIKYAESLYGRQLSPMEIDILLNALEADGVPIQGDEVKPNKEKEEK